MFIKWLAMTAGWLCIVIGSVLFVLPVPLGLPVLLLGAFLLIRSSYRARRVVARFFRKDHVLGRHVTKLRLKRRRYRQQNLRCDIPSRKQSEV